MEDAVVFVLELWEDILYSEDLKTFLRNLSKPSAPAFKSCQVSELEHQGLSCP
jgi:hypothetical protein